MRIFTTKVADLMISRAWDAEATWSPLFLAETGFPKHTRISSSQWSFCWTTVLVANESTATPEGIRNAFLEPHEKEQVVSSSV